MTAQSSAAPLAIPAVPEAPPAVTLKNLLEDGLYMQFLLRNGSAPQSASQFNSKIDEFFHQFDKHARNFGKSAEAIHDSKYAFCALLDEIVLSSSLPIREDWEGNPLQLRIFGDHLAGEHFFEKLEELRRDPQRNLETIEVFHTCLTLGFQGKYLLEGTEKLGYLTSKVSQEILSLRGGKAEFAPHWKPPFRFQEFVRHELPVWLFYLIIGLVALLIFIGFTFILRSQVKDLAFLDRLPAETAPLLALAR